MSEKVLVTGAAGFIGAATSRELARQGKVVLGLDNLNSYYDPQLKADRIKAIQAEFPQIKFEKLDLCDKTSLFKTAVQFNPDYIVHLAAQPGVRYSLENPQAYTDSNITGFLNILELSRQLKPRHLTYASSSSVYGASAQIPYNPHNPTDHPISLYAATKKANEMMAHCYSHLFGIPTTGLRFFTVYGPWGRPDMAIYSFTKKILAGETIELFNYGKHKRDFTYVDDIVEGVCRVIFKPAEPDANWDAKNPDTPTSKAPYRIYNIGNHSPVLLSDFIASLERHIGKKAIIKLKEIQPGDVEDTFADVSDLQKDFNFHPDTDLDTGVKKFVDWYKKYHK